MRVREVMTREVRSCHASDPLSAAAKIMWELPCGAVPVVDEQGKLVGIITDRDICLAAYTRGRPLSDLQVETAMTGEVWTVKQQDSLGAAEALMQEKRVRRLPVVDAERRLVGILSLHDLAEEAVRQRSAITHQVTEEEVGRTLAEICAPRPSKGIRCAEGRGDPPPVEHARAGVP
jgi:CBS domain-containing protein